MKTIIKTTLKGSESITIGESVDDVYEKLMDKGGFCLFTRIDSRGKSKMIIKKSVVKLVITRK
jgi:hypothetical protein